MKKNFFKKLSFVLALAMIISVIAPAAGAFAATSLSLNATTTKTLHLSGQPGSNDYNFNINGTKQKGWKYQWTSSNEAVATVASNGVATAVGIGTADITVTVKDSKGAEVAKLTGHVSVKDNIETVKISNPLAADKTLKVNEVYDFNRTFTTLAGSTTKTTSVTRWTVDKTDKATIDESGKFKASEAGQYKVTALAFQSTAKYDEWVKTNNASLVLDTDETTVTVVAGIEKTEQLTLKKFQVTFDTDMSKSDLSKDTAKVYQIINGKQYETGTEKIKELKVNGKVATVEMYTEFNQSTDYNFVYGKLVGAFKSAKVDVTEVKSLRFDDFTVDIAGSGFDMNTKVAGLNADGVEIYPASASSALTNLLSFTYGGENTKGFQSGDMVYMYVDGYSAPVTAKFENYVYNDTTKTYDKVSFTDGAIATATKADNSLNASSMQYAVVKSGSAPAADNAAWSAAKSAPAGDGGFAIFTRYKLNSDAADAAYRNANTTGNITLSYESTNTDKLLVAGNTLYPISQGTVVVLVKNTDGKVVGSFDLAIVASRSYAIQTVDKNYVTVGNNAAYAESASVVVTNKDSMNETIPSTVLDTRSASFDRAPSNVTVYPKVDVVEGSGDNDGKVTITVTGNNGGQSATEGAYVIKVPIVAYGTEKDVYVTAQVLDGKNDLTVVNWKVELGAGSVDLKDNASQDVSISVYGYNSKNVRVAKLTSAQYAVTVKKGNGNDADNFTDTSIAVVRPTSGAAVATYAVDTYTVTATVEGAGAGHPIQRQNGSFINAAQFSVTNTTSFDKSVVTTVVANGDILQMVKDAFNFKLNGNDLDESQIYSVNFSKGTGILKDSSSNTALENDVDANNSAYINSVTVHVPKTVGGVNTYISITIPVNVTIKAN